MNSNETPASPAAHRRDAIDRAPTTSAPTSDQGRSHADTRADLPPAPIELYLEVTNRCNLRCRTCPQFFGMAERFHDLTWDRFLAITEQVHELRRVVLHGIGEPLLNRDLGRMIRHLKGRGAYVLFNSNGLLLRGEKARGLIESGLDELRISIDGGSRETYRAVRGVDGFDRILANIRRFEALKREAGVSAPRLSLWLTGMKLNVADLPPLVRAAAANGVREVYLQRLVYSGRGLATEEQALFGRAGDEGRDAVSEALRLAAELGVAFRGSGELGPGEAIDRAAPGDAPWRGCFRPWRLMYITANGAVLPCCIAPFTATPYAGNVLGDLTVSSIAEVWNGDRYRAWRSAMLEGEPPAPCKGCGVVWSL
jgi:MoaA/NifB/PqqE/SkfB family radical SAM enzyme